MRAILETVAEPYTMLLLLLGVALSRVWWCGRSAPAQQSDQPSGSSRRLGLILLTCWWVVLSLISTPIVGCWALGTLEKQNPPSWERPVQVQAIVVLAGAVAHHDPVLERSQLSGATLDRTWHGYRLFRLGVPCPVLVCGGKGEPTDLDPPPAQVMAAELRRLGVPDHWIIIEAQSTNTQENALHCARLAHEKGWTCIQLVTDGQHLPRAVTLFREQGLQVIPSGCRYRTLDWTLSASQFFPSWRGLGWFQEASREWLRLAIRF